MEADDVIATLATQGRDRGDEVIIVTGDRDSYQLVVDQLQPQGLGALMMAPALGAFMMGLVLAHRPPLAEANHAVVRGHDLVHLGMVQLCDALHGRARIGAWS